MHEEDVTYTPEIPPAEMTQVVAPVKPDGGGGETTMLEPVPEPEAEIQRKTGRKIRKKRGGLVTLIVAVVLVGTAAALEFVPGSPLEHTIRYLIDPPVRVEATGLEARGCELVLPPRQDVELGVVLDVPADWEMRPEETPIPESSESEAAEASVEGEGIPEAEPSEPTPAERLAELKGRAFELIKGNALETSAFSFTYEPEALEYEPERRFAYVTENRSETVARSATDFREWRYSPFTFDLTSPFITITIELEPGDYAASASEYIIDEFGFAWKTEATDAYPLHTSIGSEILSSQLFYHPVDLATISEEEYAAILAVAGEYAPAVEAVRAMAIWEPEEEGPEEGSGESQEGQEGSDTPEGNGATGGGTGQSGQGGSGNGNGSGNGSGAGSGGGSGQGSQGGNGNQGGSTEPPATGHTHTLATRNVYVGTQDVTVVDVLGHMGTVHHDAVYNDWTEQIAVCNDCGAVLTNPSQHMESTGPDRCNSWHTETVYHHDLVSEAWDEEAWIPDQTHVVTYAMYVTETYCVNCGEVTATSEPWHY